MNGSGDHRGFSRLSHPARQAMAAKTQKESWNPGWKTWSGFIKQRRMKASARILAGCPFLRSTNARSQTDAMMNARRAEADIPVTNTYAASKRIQASRAARGRTCRSLSIPRTSMAATPTCMPLTANTCMQPLSRNFAIVSGLASVLSPSTAETITCRASSSGGAPSLSREAALSRSRREKARKRLRQSPGPFRQYSSSRIPAMMPCR